MPILVGLLLWPLLEIVGFVWLGPILGVGGTLAFVLLSGVAGMSLLRSEGIGTLMRVRAELRAGAAPVPAALDGACRMAAAMLLIVPGFFSTAVGSLLLLPPVRALLVSYLLRRGVAAGLHQAAPGVWTVGFGGKPPSVTPTIEGEFREVGRNERDLPPR